ncbi:primosomal protein N' [soil metagenome]
MLDVADHTATDATRVRELAAVQGDQLWFDADDLRLYRWVAHRYAATLADVLRHALPQRVAAVEREPGVEPGAVAEPPTGGSGPVETGSHWGPYAVSALLRATGGSGPAGAFWLRPLPGEDTVALVADLLALCAASGRSALVLAPDPASPLLPAALEIAGSAGADLRPGVSDRDRYRAFLRCRSGRARVAAGERGAVFAPLRELGLVVVADEANPAYKERRAPRHHARDVALARARMAGATTVVLGDLPGARLQRLLADGHVSAVRADRGAERDRAPRVDVVDLGDPRPGARRARFAPLTSRAIGRAVEEGGVAVVLAARGGQGAALACSACGDRRACPVCDGSLRATRNAGGPDGREWQCPACGWTGQAFSCRTCGDERTAPLAAGAGRLAQELARAYRAAEVVRMEGFDAPGPTRRPAVAVMTRGSAVTRPMWLSSDDAKVVALPDADALLGLPVLDAAEDTLRLWFAVARWTDHVVLQTRDPGHHAVQALVRWDPDGFWEREAPRRAELRYPPAGHLVRIVAPVGVARDVGATLRGALPDGDEVLGPGPDGALLVKTSRLRGTLDALIPLRHAWSKADAKVRVDVDPVLTQ